MSDSRTVVATIGRDKFNTQLSNAVHSLVADEPVDAGGQDAGPTPGDYMRMSLASCTAITLRMYANRKQLDVEKIVVTVTSGQQQYKTVFTCVIAVTGNITEEQRARLEEIAHRCPVHKVLTNPIEIETKLVLA
ncbi:OsmC family protein [Chryseolinea lacunae]|uniref:OsmC family protein n=1 Tax=Chryseolinea lacunae TaxID=2801331 RepID=A0ABS1KUS7_9BACT|nr:OsmC family protein [Chryseolinea lacunae]MBL0742071.1 OsmC family protein [Chryseolinea lacunae]